MRILLLNDYGQLSGGAERITIELRDGLRARGHYVRLMASTAASKALPNLADFTCFGTNGPARPFLQMWNPWAVSRLRQVLAEFRPDVVHVRMFLTQLSPSILPLLASVPSLLHVGNHQTICPLNTRVLPDGSRCMDRAGRACLEHGCISAFGLGRALLQLRAWRLHAATFRLIVANSRGLARTLRENDVRVDTVIPNGTRDMGPSEPLSEPPSVAFAGRLVRQKGVDLLVQAMATVIERHRSARLLIAGDGPERSRIEGLVTALGLRPHVTLCGHVPHPELAARLSRAWVQVVPSRSPEPGANVIPEAMMRSRAVVATRFDDPPEGLRDGITGFLTPPFDASTLANRLIELLSSRALAEHMGQSGREIALAELTTDLMIDRFESVYARMLRRA